LLHEKEKEESDFTNKSVFERLSILRESTIRCLENKGYKKWSVYKNYYQQNYQFDADEIKQGTYNNIFSINKSKDIVSIINVHAYQSATKEVLLKLLPDRYSLETESGNELLDHNRSGSGYGFVGLNQMIKKIKAKRISLTFLLISLNNLTTVRIESNFQQFLPIDKGKIYKHTTTNSLYEKVPIEETLIFISGVKSKNQFISTLNGIISNPFVVV
jgi:hypothetical protein